MCWLIVTSKLDHYLDHILCSHWLMVTSKLDHYLDHVLCSQWLMVTSKLDHHLDHILCSHWLMVTSKLDHHLDHILCSNWWHCEGGAGRRTRGQARKGSQHYILYSRRPPFCLTAKILWNFNQVTKWYSLSQFTNMYIRTCSCHVECLYSQ